MIKLDYSRAACRDTDPDYFFPMGKGGRRSHNKDQVAGSTEALEQQASRFCRDNNCEILGDCLSYALEKGEQGVWGGTSSEQRVEILRRRKKQGTQVMS